MVPGSIEEQLIAALVEALKLHLFPPPREDVFTGRVVVAVGMQPHVFDPHVLVQRGQDVIVRLHVLLCCQIQRRAVQSCYV